MTSHLPPGQDLREGGALRFADWADLLRAACVERASGRRVARARDLTTQTHGLPALADSRNGVEKGSGVWMERLVEHLRCRTFFRHASEVHHYDPVADVSY